MIIGSKCLPLGTLRIQLRPLRASSSTIFRAHSPSLSVLPLFRSHSLLYRNSGSQRPQRDEDLTMSEVPTFTKTASMPLRTFAFLMKNTRSRQCCGRYGKAMDPGHRIPLVSSFSGWRRSSGWPCCSTAAFSVLLYCSRFIHSPSSPLSPTTSYREASSASSSLGGKQYFPRSPSSTWDPSTAVSTSRCKHWMSLLVYGTAHAPLLGTCWPPLLSVRPMDLTELREEPSMLHHALSPYSSASFRTRELYCKAVVSASGGHRMARDYIAGLTAAVEGDEGLVALCLQHPVTEEDVEVLCQHLLDTWCEEQEKAEEEAEKTADLASSTMSSSLGVVEEKDSNECIVEAHSQKESGEAVSEGRDAEEDISEEGMRTAELFILAFSPIIRCFLYDVMCAATYQRTRNRLLMEKTEKKLIHLGVHVLGVPRERVMALWKVVLAEAHLKKETYNLLVPLIE